MKRYLLFTGRVYESMGGMNDLHESYDTPEEAETEGRRLTTDPQHEWAHVADITTGQIVWAI